MSSIEKAKPVDARLLAGIGAQSFIESHGHSASAVDIEKYKEEKFTEDVLYAELVNPENIYHIIYHDNIPAGYSKIILNAEHPNVSLQNVTKLERIYLLKQFYGLKLGQEFFNFNVELSKRNHQNGMWLFVWKENPRAINFYTKAGFKIIGSHDFKISDRHSNPNHQMLLVY